MNTSIHYIFGMLTRAVMTMLVCGGIYVLRLLVQMRTCPVSALGLYHSVPVLAEHILAGILVYLLFSLLFVWTASHETV